MQQAFIEGMASGFVIGGAFGLVGSFSVYYWQARLVLAGLEAYFATHGVRTAVDDFQNGHYVAGVADLALSGVMFKASCSNIKTARTIVAREASKNIGETANNKNFKNSLNSVDEIINDPRVLYGKSKEDVASILGDNWKEGSYGSQKTGWKFTNGDKSIFYHPGGGRHVGSYYGYSSASTGKIKIVGTDYISIPGDKATIIYFGRQ